MTRPKKKQRVVRAWAVCNSAGTPYLDSIASLKRLSIEAYTIRRGYDWTLCCIEDKSSCRRVRITVEK